MSLHHNPRIVTDSLVLALDVRSPLNYLTNGPEDFFGDGHFPNQSNMASESGSNAPNSIISLKNPGMSSYVLAQGPSGTFTEYQINPAVSSSYTSTPLCMSGWYAESSDYSGASRMFHSRTFSAGGAHTSLGTGIGTQVTSRTIGEIVWTYRYAVLTTPSDFTGTTNWYVGYGNDSYTGYRYYTNLRMIRGTVPNCIDLTKNYIVYPKAGTSWNSTDNAIDLTGTDDQVIHVENVDLRKDFSLEIWCKLDALQGGFFGHGITSLQQGLHITCASNYTRFGMYGNDTDFNLPHATGVWAHYVFTYNHSTFVKNAYRNGISYTGTPVQTQTSYTAAPGTLRIGQTYGSYSTSALNGRVDVARMYNKVLTAAEIKQNFYATRERFGIYWEHIVA